MKYISICSGIEAATTAWHPLGWQPLAFSEIEPFPSAVLAHHWPDVPNLGDMTKHNDWPTTIQPNLIVGGTPCQAFSVAGLRKGLADPRGNLTLTFLSILAQYRPEWVVWENVPGVLSENTGAFGAFLGGLGELGYGFAYRILDAQYFGVAQRRRRVFVVANLTDWRRAAAVLFERNCLQGDSPPSRKPREDVAATIAARFGISRNNHEECVVPEVCGCLSDGAHNGGGLNGQDAYSGRIIPAARTFDAISIGQFKETDIAGTLTKNTGAGGETQNAAFVTHPINCTNIHNTNNQPVFIDRASFNQGKNAQFAPNINTNGVSDALVARGPHAVAVAFCMAENIIGRKPENGGNGEGNQKELAYTLNTVGVPAVAFSFDPLASNSMKSSNPHSGCREVNLSPCIDTTTPTPQKNQGGLALVNASAVRRLTPTECERLQGFPDDHTLIPWRGKMASDGPRYKALGNSMAVPVMRWIGERISKIDQDVSTFNQTK